MTQDSGMPQNPGDPKYTDPEATSADRAEAAAEEAEEAQAVNDAQVDAAEEAQLIPPLMLTLRTRWLMSTSVRLKLRQRAMSLSPPVLPLTMWKLSWQNARKTSSV